jgi:hypothetical protein
MGSTLYTEALDWKRRGYFAPTLLPDDPKFTRDPDKNLWLRFADALNRTKRGDFNGTEVLFEVHEHAQLGLIKWVCSQLMGDAGKQSQFRRLISELEESLDPDKASHYCNSLSTWGTLAAVPAILQSYERYHGFQDFESIPVYLSTILEPEWGPLVDKAEWENPDTYCDLVMRRCEELRQLYGSEQIPLLHGEQFGVVALARRMLRNLGGSHFEKAMQPFYRRRFEASTGIDCSCFYQGREFQPLTVAALLEEFLESPEAARYEDGVRYFFGHRIPE